MQSTSIHDINTKSILQERTPLTAYLQMLSAIVVMVLYRYFSSIIFPHALSLIGFKSIKIPFLVPFWNVLY